MHDLALTRCMKITREDGEIYRVTEHDQTLTIHEGVFDGSSDPWDNAEVYSPVDGWDASNARAEAAMKEANIELTGVFGGTLVTSSDIQAGLWDMATIDDFRVDWRYPWHGVIRHQVYRLGDFKYDNEVWVAQAYNRYSEFQKKSGNVYRKLCHHAFGNAACGVNTSNPGTTVFKCLVEDGNGDSSYNITMQFDIPGDAASYDGADDQEDDFFAMGHIVWTTGDNKGQIYPVRSNTKTGRILDLRFPTRVPFADGDRFDVYAGCDKARATCRDVYSNMENYGGFTFIPGTATLMKTGQMGGGD